MKTLDQAISEAHNGISVEENEVIILSSKDAYACLVFAMSIKGANIKALQEVVLNVGGPYWCYYFAKNVLKADKQALSQKVLESLDKKYIDMFYYGIDFDKTNYETYFKNLIFE